MPILDYRKGTVLSPAGHDCIREALMLSEFYNVAVGSLESFCARWGRPDNPPKIGHRERYAVAVSRVGLAVGRIASIDLFLVRTVAFQQRFALLVSTTKRRCGLWCPQTRRPSGWRARLLKPASKRLVGGDLPVARAQNNFESCGRTSRCGKENAVEAASWPISDYSLIVRTALEVGWPSPPSWTAIVVAPILS